MTGVPDDLLRKLCCLVSRAPLVQVGDWLYSTDAETRKRYPIRDGIPVMLIEESEAVGPEEFERAMAEASRPDASAD